MTPYLKSVTVTGADDSVAPDDLLVLAKEYPYAEFGLLLSRNSMGRTRFPSAAWLRDAVATIGGRVQCSGHLCGSWVREILLGRWPKWDFFEIDEILLGLFDRWQINTHGIPHEYDWPKFRSILRELTAAGQEVIFQYDKANTEILRLAVDEGFRVSALYDLSHGAGIVPDRWEKPAVSCYTGYAGGLSPTNVEEHLPQIARIAEGAPAWIDAETHLRSEDGRTFDRTKVAAFLGAAREWVRR